MLSPTDLCWLWSIYIFQCFWKFYRQYRSILLSEKIHIFKIVCNCSWLVDTLNTLSKKVIFNETQKITILEDVVTKSFPCDRFWTILALLKAKVAAEKRSFTFDELASEWHTLEKEFEDGNHHVPNLVSHSLVPFFFTPIHQSLYLFWVQQPNDLRVVLLPPPQ